MWSQNNLLGFQNTPQRKIVIPSFPRFTPVVIFLNGELRLRGRRRRGERERGRKEKRGEGGKKYGSNAEEGVEEEGRKKRE